MKEVDPIKDVEMIYNIMDHLKEKNERDYVLFCLGIYAPLRISDILKLKVKDVKDTSICTTEKKTKKKQIIEINDELWEILVHYISDKKNNEYLFASQQKSADGFYRAISRQRADQIMRDVKKKFGLNRFACHSLRKTFGYFFYQETKDIELLRQIYNHSNTSKTRDYIGLSQEVKNAAIRDFSLRNLSNK